MSKITVRTRTPFSICLLAVCVACLLASCGGGSAANTKASKAVLSGNWEFVMAQQTPVSPAVKMESGFLVQSGGAVSGGVLLSGQALCPGLGSLQGTVNGTAVVLNVTQVAQTINFTGTTVADGSSMSGSYSIFASGCGGGSTAGTFTGTQIKPITGNFMAAFTSGDQTGLIYNLTVAVNQGANTGSSNAMITGTVTSADRPCANNLQVTGLVSGTSVVFSFLAADGTPVGQFRGTAAMDATTLTGTYDFNAQTSGCVADAGTATMVLQ